MTETKTGGGCSMHGPTETCGHDSSTCPDLLTEKREFLATMPTLEEVRARMADDTAQADLLQEEREFIGSLPTLEEVRAKIAKEEKEAGK